MACNLKKELDKKKYEFRLKQAENELVWMGKLKGHSNIVELIGVFRTPRGDLASTIYTTQYATDLYNLLLLLHGRVLDLSLQDHARLRKISKLHENLDNFIHELITGLINGVLAMHELGLVHHDLSPDNIFIEVLSNGRFNLRIGDFGGVALAGEERAKPVGKRSFFPPEVVMALQTKEQVVFSFRTDLWSLGIMIAMLVSRTFFDTFVEMTDISLTPTNTLGRRNVHFNFVDFAAAIPTEIEKVINPNLLQEIKTLKLDQLLDPLEYTPYTLSGYTTTSTYCSLVFIR